MKRSFSLLMLLSFICIITVGCSENEKDKAAAAIETTANVVETAANVADSMGVPLVGAIGSALGLLVTTGLALVGRGSQKRKKEALYQSTANLYVETNKMADGLKDKSISVDDVIKMLPTMVKDVSVVTHTAYGEYKAIEKDVNKYQNKGIIKKLS